MSCRVTADVLAAFQLSRRHGEDALGARVEHSVVVQYSPPVSDRKKLIAGLSIWVVVITILHLSINVDWRVALNDRLPLDKRKLNVAYIPVT